MLDQVRRDQRLPRGFHDECRRAAKLEAVLEQGTEDVAKKAPKGPVDAARQMSALLGQATITYVADLAAGAERDGTEEGILTQVDAASVRGAIEELPESLRFVILAYIYEDKSLAEIGEAKGKSERWARHTLQEALEMLREMFRDG